MFLRYSNRNSGESNDRINGEKNETIDMGKITLFIGAECWFELIFWLIAQPYVVDLWIAQKMDWLIAF